MAAFPIRWGVIGPGRIAHRFAECLEAVPGARLVAAASRDTARAAAFVAQHGGDRHHGDYAALFADEGVDAVYVATPHAHHADVAIAALAAGKAVLCEKPFTATAPQAARVFEAARTHGRFAMEAFWTRFLPAIGQVRAWVTEGRIGQVTGIEARFGFAAVRDADDRLFRTDLAGGALLDVGVYGVSIAQFLLGGPLQLREASADVGPTGVDESVQAEVAVGPQGARLRLQASIVEAFDNALTLTGTEGLVRVPDPFWMAEHVVLERHGEAPVPVHAPLRRNGFEYQVAEVQRCMAEGRLQSDVVPWADTLAVMQCLDAIRDRVGVRYPFE